MSDCACVSLTSVAKIKTQRPPGGHIVASDIFQHMGNPPYAGETPRTATSNV